VLTGLDTINICVAYEYRGKQISNAPAKISALNACKPVYEKMDGWKQDISGARTFAELPRNAQVYIKRIEKIVGVPVSIISVGSGREETIFSQNPFDQ
jgi:adenylosuccinate synthase